MATTSGNESHSTSAPENKGSFFALPFTFTAEQREKYGIHYLGIVFLLAWYYCLWFTPNMFQTVDILDNLVTYSWLATLAVSGIAFLGIPFLLKGRRLLERPIIIKAAGIVLCITTLIYTLWPNALTTFFVAMFVFPLAFGVGNAVIWLALGEMHVRKRSTFALDKLSFVFGVVMLSSICIATVLPHIAADIFVASLPILSCLCYLKENELLGNTGFPPLLPKATRQKTSRATFLISMSLFIACAACYYNIAIIPLDTLWMDGVSYVVGIMAAALFALAFSLISKITKKQAQSYRILPWLIVACIGGTCIFVNGAQQYYMFSFLITVLLAGVLEIIMIAYFGSLATKGHFAPVIAFGVSSAIERLGFFVGDGLAVLYEETSIVTADYAMATSLFFICLQAIFLVLLMRQESVIVQLTSAPASTSEIDEVCDATIAEFSLSKREGEILKYVARGYTIDGISKKLVISPYTTQTHVRHIYAKMNIHKRGELLDYLNMNRSENKSD